MRGGDLLQQQFIIDELNVFTWKNTIRLLTLFNVVRHSTHMLTSIHNSQYPHMTNDTASNKQTAPTAITSGQDQDHQDLGLAMQ